MEFLTARYDSLKAFFKMNPLLGPLSVFGATYVISSLYSALRSLSSNALKPSLTSLAKKYPGPWAFVADVSKPLGASYAELLSENGYHILTLNAPVDTPVKHVVEAMGYKFETIEVSPFCSPAADTEKFESAITGKEFGIVIMNLFYESQCDFDKEPPMAIVAQINATVVKTAAYLQTMLAHLEKQTTRSAVITVGSILGNGGWPGFQITSGCAAFVQEFAKTAKKEADVKGRVDFLHLKRGYVPKPIKNSWYRVDEKIEAEHGLRKIGIMQKAAAHYRIALQDRFHNSHMGKDNRFAYCKIGMLSQQGSH